MNGFSMFLGNHLYSIMAALTLALAAGSFLLRTTRFMFAPQVAGLSVALLFLLGTVIWGGVADLFAALAIGIPVALSGLAVKVFLSPGSAGSISRPPGSRPGL